MNEKTKILYVDDEEINRLMFDLTFQKSFEVITASSGMEGLEILNSHLRIPVVVTDIRMPGMSGLEFIQLARETHTDIDFFILSGFDVDKRIQEVLDKGWVTRFFTKPMQIAEMRKEIRKSIDRNIQ